MGKETNQQKAERLLGELESSLNGISRERRQAITDGVRDFFARESRARPKKQQSGGSK